MRKPHRTAVVLLLAVTALPCCANNDAAADKPKAEAADSSEVVAYLGEETITMADVEKMAGDQLAELEQQRYDMIKQAAEQVAVRRMIDAELAKRSITEEELFRTEVMTKVTPPTEEEIQAFWERVKAQAGDRSLDEVRPQIVAQLERQKQQVRMQDYVEQLKQGRELRVVYDPPRKEIDLPANVPSKGPADAPVTVVEYSDFDCPFCRRTHPAVEQLLTEYGDKIRFVYRDFPLAMHDRAKPASQAALCAGEQDKYWAYFDSLMEVEGDLSDENLKQRAETVGLDVASFTECYQSGKFSDEVDQAMEEGQSLGVTGTPTFFINGRMIVGAATYEQLKEVVEDELGRAGAATAEKKS